MKQLLFMIVVTGLGISGPLMGRPFWGIVVYYLYAVLRPQYLWKWSLPEFGWTFYVALSTILALVIGLDSRRTTTTTPQLPLASTHKWILLFGAWVSLTYFTAYNRNVAFPYLVEYLKLFAMFWVAARIIRTVSEMWTLYLLTTFTLCYIGAEVNDLYFRHGGYMLLVKSGLGGLDNNGGGLMLAMGVPLCYFAWEGIRSYWRWLYLALIPVLIHAVLMSYSRGAMLSLIGAIPLYLLYSRHRLQMFFALGIMAMLVPVLAGKEIRQRFFTIAEHAQDDSANSRKTSWSIAIRMANQHPIFGMGIRNSNLFTRAWGADMEGRTIHSQYLQTAADSGWVALGLYLAALGSCLKSMSTVRRMAHRWPDDEARRAYAMACGVKSSLVVFCIGGAFLSLEHFELPYLLLLLGAQLGSVLSVEQSHDFGKVDANEVENHSSLVNPLQI